jgi:N-acyl-D-amino-acid deacylase
MVFAFAFALAYAQPGLVIHGGTVYDGLGGAGRKVDIRIEGDTIRAIGRVQAKKGDQVIDAKGLAVTPGFIDAHSHADGGIFEDPLAETQIRQGITTAVVGEDGSSDLPLTDFFGKLRKTPSTINFASFVGHGTIRSAVMGDGDRKPTPEEIVKMAALVEREMKNGALGLSTGLEYQPGRYGDTGEVAALAKAASKHGGMYISHVRNEDNHAMEAFRELIDIATRAKLPAQINHIKLCSARVWGQAPAVLKLMDEAAKKGVKISADVYPYLYWQSTIRVIIATEEWDDRAQWEQGLSDVGGPEHILLTKYSPDPSWAGKTIAEISKITGKDPITVIQEIIEKCHRNGNKGSESVVVTAMSEADLTAFIASPRIMFCSDGGLHGTHPRGAGSFPRILGVYVREKKVLSLAEAIRKMTSLPASRFGFKDRGVLKAGMKADLVLFDPKTVLDKSTTKDPEAKPIGISTVIVNGQPVLLDGKTTKSRPGRPLPRAGGSRA